MKKFLLPILLSVLTLTSCGATPVSTATEGESASAVTENSAQTTQNFGSTTFYELTPYDKKGTGPQKPQSLEITEYYQPYFPFDEENHIVILVDKELESEINAWIDEACAREQVKCDELVQKGSNPDTTKVSVNHECINGYLSLSVYVEYDVLDSFYGTAECLKYSCENVIFDLYTGDKLDISDIFYDGVDFISYYNNVVERAISVPMQFTAYDTVVMPQKREFVGITKDCAYIGFSQITFPKENPYFYEGFSVYCNFEDGFFRENSVVWQPRDMKGVIKFEVEPYKFGNTGSALSNFTYKKGGSVNNVIIDSILDSSIKYDKSKVDAINALAYEIADSEEINALLKTYLLRDFSSPILSEDGWFTGFLLETKVSEEKNMVAIVIGDYSVGEFPHAICRCYDLDTLNPIPTSEVVPRVMGEDWRSSCTLTWLGMIEDEPTDVTIENIDLDRVQLSSVYFDSEYPCVSFADGYDKDGGKYYQVYYNR